MEFTTPPSAGATLSCIGILASSTIRGKRNLQRQALDPKSKARMQRLHLGEYFNEKIVFSGTSR